MSCGDKCEHICISSKLFSVATGTARPLRSYIINPNSHVSIRKLKIAEGEWYSGQICLEHHQGVFVSQHWVSWGSWCIDQLLTWVSDCLLGVCRCPYVLRACGYISRVTQGLSGPEPVPDLRLTHTDTGELHWRRGLFSWCSYLRRTPEDLSCNL